MKKLFNLFLNGASKQRKLVWTAQIAVDDNGWFEGIIRDEKEGKKNNKLIFGFFIKGKRLEIFRLSNRRKRKTKPHEMFECFFEKDDTYEGTFGYGNDHEGTATVTVEYVENSNMLEMLEKRLKETEEVMADNLNTPEIYNMIKSRKDSIAAEISSDTIKVIKFDANWHIGDGNGHLEGQTILKEDNWFIGVAREKGCVSSIGDSFIFGKFEDNEKLDIFKMGNKQNTLITYYSCYKTNNCYEGKICFGPYEVGSVTIEVKTSFVMKDEELQKRIDAAFGKISFKNARRFAKIYGQEP